MPERRVRMKSKTVKATLDNLDVIQQFIEEQLEGAGCPAKVIMQISMAVEEIYVNIAHYAYQPGIGDATVSCLVGEEPLAVTIQFLDSGTPFDPLARPDADTTLPAEERIPGGLGILLVKKSMDQVDYRYEDGKNILTIKKQW